MEKEKVLKNLKGLAYKYSDDAVSVVEYVIEEYEDDCDIYDLIWENVDSAMICYSDAFNYLRDTKTTDFEDAIREGFGKNVCTIACYYLKEEVFDLLNSLGIEY